MSGPAPRPWLRAATGTWYLTLDGKQVPLGRDRKAAWEEYHRLMGVRGKGLPSAGRITVAELVEEYLVDIDGQLSPETVRPRRIRLGSLARYCGRVLARDLKPFHIHRWLKLQETWNANTRIAGATAAKRCLEWGESVGHLEANPLRKLRIGAIGRRAPITLEDAEAVMARMPAEGAQALRVLLLTGLRPGELCSLTADSVAQDLRHATVTGKSGRRAIPLSDAAIELLGPLLAIRPSGPLFVADGQPLWPGRLARMVREARGELVHVTPHCFRGLFSTLALRAGVDSAIISKLLGHSDPTILTKHYLGDVTPELRAAAEAIGRTVRSPRGTWRDGPA